jgi:hypothetical protein
MTSQTDNYLDWIKQRGGSVTLGEICQTTYVCEYRRFNSELRQKGYEVTVKLNRKEPSKNLYEVKEPMKFDESGQGVLI